MSESEDIASSAAWRSKKYMQLSDDEILQLAVRKLPDKDRLYLARELDYRKLNEQARTAKRAHIKKGMFNKPWWKFLPLLVGLAFVARRMMGSF